MKTGRIRNTTTMLIALALLLAGIIPAFAGEGEIPITTSSKEALTHFATGRELADQVRVEEARPHFEKAVTIDPNFAIAYYELAQVSSSSSAFLENLRKAVANSEKISEGERLTILALRASVDGNTTKQKELLEKLVTTYPKDKRARLVLGNFHSGQRNYTAAVEELNKAIEMAPNFSPAFNSLGYVHTYTGNLPEAEKAFKKYTELIPNEPNPHDSYAELLMKEGKFDESIKEYEKALSINPNFYSSHIGIASNYSFKGMPVEARTQLQKLYDIAPNDGVRQQTLLAMATTYLHEGKFDKALAEIQKQYAISDKSKDPIAMAQSLTFMGDILVESAEREATKSTALKTRESKPGLLDEAASDYMKARAAIDNSNLSTEIKENAKLQNLSNEVQIAVRKGDFANARTKAEEYRTRAESRGNQVEIMVAHRLAGIIALHEKKADIAVKELQQADQRNPRNLYLLAQAFEVMGNKEKAAELTSKLASFNEIGFDYALVRNKTIKQ